MVYPPRVDATPEEIAQLMFQLPHDHQWKYETEPPEYKCEACGKAVHYPDVLHREGLCQGCRATSI